MTPLAVSRPPQRMRTSPGAQSTRAPASRNRLVTVENCSGSTPVSRTSPPAAAAAER